ncbi:hypothetical protein M413DRAFT_177018 [Hebeloma cylindrosporum]|uniref:Uncharacterized protein n=1 Tax=Hebeloma cylindrosporum TaxID=76867 RepID=A0A0C3C7W4_HEBCY|nr:hypothetical protein M413DRAFT_177018 [Hebeloma cylindrosporum h7]
MCRLTGVGCAGTPRHLESICDPRTQPIPTRDLHLILGICTEFPRPTSRKFSCRASKVILSAFVSCAPGCEYCGRGLVRIHLSETCWLELLSVPIQGHQFIPVDLLLVGLDRKKSSRGKSVKGFSSESGSAVHKYSDAFSKAVSRRS